VQTHRFLISFISTICLYLVLGLFFFYISTLAVGTESKPKEQTISFSLSSYEPEVVPPVKEEVIEEMVEPEPIVEEIEPEEPTVEEITHKPLPQPIVEKTIPKPIPVVKKKVVKKKKSKKKSLKKKVVKHKKQVKKVRKKSTKRKVKKSSSQQASPAKKNAFLAKIRGKINRNKTYPRIAQRRGMQGSVKVSFTILPNGHVSNIRISGKKVFYKSARTAIQKAFPISTKNVPLSFPITINLPLHYQIR